MYSPPAVASRWTVVDRGVLVSETGTGRFCPHCGAIAATRLGQCKVCALAACEKCGNIQHVQAGREVVHNECLHKTGDSFSMIKFVR